MSRLSRRSASSVSLASMIPSSNSDDYYSCADETALNDLLFEETLYNEIDLEELSVLQETDIDDQPSIVLIYSIATSPIVSPNLSLCPLLSLPFIPPSTIERAVQMEEHDFYRLREWATIVGWDPRLPGTFPLESPTSILPPWWRSEECLGTFGFPAYQRLSKELADGGQFLKGHPQSDDMEGRGTWDPSAPETLPERTQRINLVHRRCVAIVSGSADQDFLATLRAAADARARAEAVQAAEEGELSPYDSEDDAEPMWFDESVWLEPFHVPFINARAPIQQPPPQFIPGCGFATYLVRPALQALLP